MPSQDFVDPEKCLAVLEEELRRRFPRVSLDVQTADRFDAIGSFGTSRAGDLRLTVTISNDGTASIGTAEGLMVELSTPTSDLYLVVSRLLETVEPLGVQGLEYVRTLPLLGPLSPSWVGAARSNEVVAAKRKRFAQVVRSAAAWGQE